MRHFHERFDIADLMETYPEMKLASIGPETTRWLRSWSWTHVEAKQHTGIGLANAIAEYELRHAMT